MSTYQTGGSESLIWLETDVQTEGLAVSRAVIKSNQPTMPGVPVAHSVNATGDIIATQIGIAGQLQNKKLSILTKVDFWGDKSQRKAQYESLSILYTLRGGEDGEKPFSEPMKSVDASYTSALLHQLINLT